MKPERFGRTLGIGARVASGMLRQRAMAAAAAPPLRTTQQRSQAPGPPATAAPPIASGKAQLFEQSSRLSRGAKNFGQSVWSPLRHAGSVLWLEVTGLFFALFAVFFIQSAYRTRTFWKQGAEHDHFLLYLALSALFVWFSASSFLRARRKSLRQRDSGSRR